MAGLEDFLRHLFGDDEPPEYDCDDMTCVAEVPVEIVLAVVTNSTLDVPQDEIARLCVFVLRDFGIPIASAPAAIIATATELKKQHEWLNHVVLPDELSDRELSGAAHRACLYRWYADMITLHGCHLDIHHAEDPEWVRGQKPRDAQEQLLRDGYEHLGEGSV